MTNFVLRFVLYFVLLKMHNFYKRYLKLLKFNVKMDKLYCVNGAEGERYEKNL